MTKDHLVQIIGRTHGGKAEYVDLTPAGRIVAAGLTGSCD
jgi:hypothetical protein